MYTFLLVFPTFFEGGLPLVKALIKKWNSVGGEGGGEGGEGEVEMMISGQDCVVKNGIINVLTQWLHINKARKEWQDKEVNLMLIQFLNQNMMGEL